MSFGKRQLILAALVVSLGAAVYLNWQFSGDGGLETVDATVSEKELGAAQLVNGSDILTEIPANSESAVSELPEESVPSEETNAPVEDYFSQAALNRQKTRDEAIEMLDQILNDSTASPEELQKAVDESAAIAKNMLNESSIESLIKSKGYTDCVAFIHDAECSIVVGKREAFTAEDAAIIKDIVVGQCEIPYGNIRIVDHITA